MYSAFKGKKCLGFLEPLDFLKSCIKYRVVVYTIKLTCENIISKDDHVLIDIADISGRTIMSTPEEKSHYKNTQPSFSELNLIHKKIYLFPI